MATQYTTITVSDALNALEKQNTPSKDKPEGVKKALQKALKETDENQQILKAALAEKAASAKATRSQKEDAVTSLSRQRDGKKVSKDFMSGLRKAEEQIFELKAEAADLVAGFTAAGKQLAQWGPVFKRLVDAGSAAGVESLAQQLTAANTNAGAARAASIKTIAAMDDDHRKIGELIRQTKGILADADKKAKAETEASDVVETINKGCKDVIDSISDCETSGTTIRKTIADAEDAASQLAKAAATILKSTSAGKLTNGGGKTIEKAYAQTLKDLAALEKEAAAAANDSTQMRKDLGAAKDELEKWEKMQALLVKTLSLNYPKIVHAAAESEASINAVQQKLRDLRKLEEECGSLVKTLNQTVKDTQARIGSLSKVMKSLGSRS